MMLSEIIHAHRNRLLLAYFLTSAGMVAGLLYPLATGLAINGVLSGDYLAVLWLVGCHAAQLMFTVASKRFDTRVFTHMFGSLASAVVARSRSSGLAPARAAARVSLSREYTLFLEEDVPRIIYAGIALIISLGALAFIEPSLALTCLILGGALLFVGRWLNKKSVMINAGLNNRLEKEIELISTATDSQVYRHFQALAGWRIKLSDAEATVFGVMEILVIALFVVALWQIGAADSKPRAGEVFAIFSYLWRFVGCVDQAPILIQKFAKLGDIDRRLARIP